MNTLALPTISDSQRSATLCHQLTQHVRGDVRFDRLSRAIYSTDASIYEITPTGVVLPKSVDDVVAAMKICRDHKVPIIARGAGTGLTGGAVGRGVVIDLSRHMNSIGPLDVARRTITVQPGVVLDDLNRHLAPYQLQFAPDVATSSRATLGGMLSNNSCGAHSVRYGRTVDHVTELTCVLADGEIVRFQRNKSVEFSTSGSDFTAISNSRAAQIEQELGSIRNCYIDEIQRRFPKVMRSNGGYGLDRLGPAGSPVDATRLLCGSEGTLAIIVEAKLNVVPLPTQRELVLIQHANLIEALATVPEILAHKPAAIELIDRLIIDAGRANPGIRERCGFLQGDPEALLVVEFFDDDADRLAQSVRALMADGRATSGSSAVLHLKDSSAQADVWNLRKSGLGLLMSKPGDLQPYSFVEDTAVDPGRLAEYIRKFGEVLQRENVSAGYYAHASVGCLHVKPVLNLKNGADVERMRRIASAVCDLAVEFGGTMTGEHGDGIVRSCWLEQMYGPTIMRAFGEVKELFDPEKLLNPGKIVDPLPMTENLRFGESYRSNNPRTSLNFASFGGMAGLAEMCSGVGQCRQKQTATMCPSYLATGDETHTTRARANALRMALSNRGLLHGLGDEALDEVMELCISCKACKSECPTGVDMARLKSEWLSYRNLARGVSPRARMIADAPRTIEWASRAPRLFNLILGSRAVRRYAERKYGFDARVPIPRIARQTFRQWFRKHKRGKKAGESTYGRVLYFVDTWTNFCTPDVGKAAVSVLEKAGFDVICPNIGCCGRPAISQGLLTEAQQLAEANIRALAPFLVDQVPIVGTEPSCLLTFVDEYPQLVRTPLARKLGESSQLIDTFIARLLEAEPTALQFRQPDRSLLLHAHCHQKALVGTGHTMGLLQAAFGEHATEIASGCCGMAGAFGHEKEHYEVARAIGEDRLFPAVRARGDGEIAVSGFSCRHQIAHHTDATPRHFIERIAELVL